MAELPKGVAKSCYDFAHELMKEVDDNGKKKELEPNRVLLNSNNVLCDEDGVPTGETYNKSKAHVLRKVKETSQSSSSPSSSKKMPRRRDADLVDADEESPVGDAGMDAAETSEKRPAASSSSSSAKMPRRDSMDANKSREHEMDADSEDADDSSEDADMGSDFGTATRFAAIPSSSSSFYQKNPYHESEPSDDKKNTGDERTINNAEINTGGVSSTSTTRNSLLPSQIADISKRQPTSNASIGGAANLGFPWTLTLPPVVSSSRVQGRAAELALPPPASSSRAHGPAVVLTPQPTTSSSSRLQGSGSVLALPPTASRSSHIRGAAVSSSSVYQSTQRKEALNSHSSTGHRQLKVNSERPVALDSSVHMAGVGASSSSTKQAPGRARGNNTHGLHSRLDGGTSVQHTAAHQRLQPAGAFRQRQQVHASPGVAQLPSAQQAPARPVTQSEVKLFAIIFHNLPPAEKLSFIARYSPEVVQAAAAQGTFSVSTNAQHAHPRTVSGTRQAAGRAQQVSIGQYTGRSSLVRFGQESPNDMLLSTERKSHSSGINTAQQQASIRCSIGQVQTPNISSAPRQSGGNPAFIRELHAASDQGVNAATRESISPSSSGALQAIMGQASGTPPWASVDNGIVNQHRKNTAGFATTTNVGITAAPQATGTCTTTPQAKITHNNNRMLAPDIAARHSLSSSQGVGALPAPGIPRSASATPQTATSIQHVQKPSASASTSMLGGTTPAPSNTYQRQPQRGQPHVPSDPFDFLIDDDAQSRLGRLASIGSMYGDDGTGTNSNVFPQSSQHDAISSTAMQHIPMSEFSLDINSARDRQFVKTALQSVSSPKNTTLGDENSAASRASTSTRQGTFDFLLDDDFELSTLATSRSPIPAKSASQHTPLSDITMTAASASSVTTQSTSVGNRSGSGSTPFQHTSVDNRGSASSAPFQHTAVGSGSSASSTPFQHTSVGDGSSASSAHFQHSSVGNDSSASSAPFQHTSVGDRASTSFNVFQYDSNINDSIDFNDPLEYLSLDTNFQLPPATFADNSQSLLVSNMPTLGLAPSNDTPFDSANSMSESSPNRSTSATATTNSASDSIASNLSAVDGALGADRTSESSAGTLSQHERPPSLPASRNLAAWRASMIVASSPPSSPTATIPSTTTTHATW